MDSLDPLDPTRKATGNRWLDLIVPASAILIAVVSLFIALRQSKIMEQQLAASSWPYLQFGTSNQDDQGKPAITFDVENAGVGPAHVHGITMSYDGHPVTSTKGILDACCADLRAQHPVVRWSRSTLREQVLTPNRLKHIFTLPDAPENAPYWERLNAVGPKFVVRICYCSVLNQCWILDSSKVDLEDVKACPAPQPGDYDG